MNRKKIALLTIPICAVLIAIGAFFTTFEDKELTTSSDTSVEIQNEILPQAYAAKPNFVTLTGNETVSQTFLDDNEFIIQEVACKIKMANILNNSDVMWCEFEGSIDIDATFLLISQLPPQNIAGFIGNVIQNGATAESFVGFLLLEFLNDEIESHTGMDLSDPNGFEAELHTICEELDQPDPICHVGWKVKEMWG